MATEIYPIVPVPSFTFNYEEGFSTIVSDFEGENEQRQSARRFGRRNFGMDYKTIIVASEWYLLHDFFRKKQGGLTPFWFFDFFKKNWTDEYVGRGGPFWVDGAVADDGGVQTDEITGASESGISNDMTLLPAVPAVNDAYYFGKSFMFDKLTVCIGIPGVGTWTITWEYWNGSAWAALSGVTDGTTHFRAAAGDRDVTFTMPSNWVDCEVKSRNLYWIRARVSAYTSVTTQPKGSYAKVNTKTYDLHSKSTTNDASLIAYVNGVVTAKTFVSGGGGGGADRITFAGYQATGALITSDFQGYLRIKAVMPDRFIDQQFSPLHTAIGTVKVREVQW